MNGNRQQHHTTRTAQLAAFLHIHGRPPRESDPAERTIARWVRGRRWELDRLPAEQVRMIEATGISLTPREDAWNQMLDAVEAFKHREQRLPDRHAADPAEARLGEWIRYQRRLADDGRLAPHRRAALVYLGIL